MKYKLFCAIFLLYGIVFCAGPVQGASEGPVFDVITVDSAITPAIAEYIEMCIDDVELGSGGLIILLDTPGGLDTSMRDIVKKILNAPVPVIVFVYPPGARAASAGVLITMAAHIAAMSPGTNIGAAHPVAVGFGGKMDDTMAEKVENDAVAYAVGIAEKRQRNVEWAAQAVRKSVSITAEEALKKKVIDVVAENISELLSQIDGKKVFTSSGPVTLSTKSAIINERKMGLRERILTSLSNPNIAYLLLLIGLAGLYFEFSNPGAILPGVVGAISLILAFFAMQTLPVNYAGILLIIFAVVLFIAEIKIISHGLLTVAGIISLVLGSLLLFSSAAPVFQISLGVMIPAIVVISAFFAGVILLAVRAQVRHPATGEEGMIGQTGKTITPVHEDGKIFIKGEYWNACSRTPIEKGETVRVVRIRGLILEVEQFSQ
ncbi:MAG: nodulation protein NfeD [Syntrophales bacterium]|nr:nodulation protein NfeD [Syntrophales bacterium]MDY0043279.1 nodulation protein NfeD [Syntrophales bacterium]